MRIAERGIAPAMKTVRPLDPSFRNPQSAFLSDLPFEYGDQLLNRGRQTELLAGCAQT
jgi:hypothetical protein